MTKETKPTSEHKTSTKQAEKSVVAVEYGILKELGDSKKQELLDKAQELIDKANELKEQAEEL